MHLQLYWDLLTKAALQQRVSFSFPSSLRTLGISRPFDVCPSAGCDMVPADLICISSVISEVDIFSVDHLPFPPL